MNSQESPETLGGGNKGGAPVRNGLQIDWHARLKAIGKSHDRLAKTVAGLYIAGKEAGATTVQGERDFREKINGKRPASDAFASAVFNLTGFAEIGLTLDDWIADDKAWAAVVSLLGRYDALAVLESWAAASHLTVAIKSHADQLPIELRRITGGPPPENILRIGQYCSISAHFRDADITAPIYLLALEWSANDRDWQAFNAVNACLLDTRKPVGFRRTPDGSRATIPLGVQVNGPSADFDLYLLAQPREFDHRALAILDRLDPATGFMRPLDMARLLDWLEKSGKPPQVAKTRYRVV